MGRQPTCGRPRGCLARCGRGHRIRVQGRRPCAALAAAAPAVARSCGEGRRGVRSAGPSGAPACSRPPRCPPRAPSSACSRCSPAARRSRAPRPRPSLPPSPSSAYFPGHLPTGPHLTYLNKSLTNLIFCVSFVIEIKYIILRTCRGGGKGEGKSAVSRMRRPILCGSRRTRMATRPQPPPPTCWNCVPSCPQEGDRNAAAAVPGGAAP